MPDISIKLKINEDGSVAQTLDKTTDQVTKLGDEGEKAGKKLSGAGKAGLDSFVKGANDLKASFDVLKGAFDQSLGMIQKVNDLGTASLRMKGELDSLTKGNADAYLSSMSAAAGGLVSDLDLATASVKALRTGAAEGHGDLQKIAQYGAEIGMSLGVSAAEGVKKLTEKLVEVGSVDAMKDLNLDADKVQEKFETLRKTMGDKDAWRLAIFEQMQSNIDKYGSSLDTAGTAVDRLNVKFENLAATISERVATGLEGIIGLTELMASGQWNPLTGEITPDPSKKSGDKVARGFGGDETITPQDEFLRKWTVGSGGNTKWLDSMSGDVQQDRRWLDMTIPMDQLAPEEQIKRLEQFAKGRRTMSGRGNDTEALPERPELDMGKHEIGRRQAGMANQQLIEDAVAMQKLHEQTKGVNLALEDQNNILERRKAIQSVNQAFNVTGDGLFAEVGGGMDDAIAKRRAAYEDELKKKGVRGGALEGEMAKFDADAKTTMDAYAVATGQATAESIAFRDMVTQVNAAFAEGKIGSEEYRAQLLALGEAAKSGYTDLESLDRIQMKLFLRQNPDRAGDGESIGMLPGAGKGVAGTENLLDGMFGPAIKSATEVSDRLQEVIGTADRVGSTISTAGATGASGLRQVSGVSEQVMKDLDRLAQKAGTIKFSVEYIPASGGGATGTMR